jgi:phospholipase D1/2
VNRILRPGRNCGPLRPVREAALLVDARSYYRAFHDVVGRAESFVLVSGWQFDSEVTLLRGKDLPLGEEVRLLPFLRNRCEPNPDLRIYILAWDFNSVFALEREWFQRTIFDWSAGGRIRFVFDSAHPVGASHHQKFVVADGTVAFVGGVDLCSNRWDDRRHCGENPDRVSVSGEPYEPYHDMQAFLDGPAALDLVRLFERRWEAAAGERLRLGLPEEPLRHHRRGGLPLRAAAVALSRTQPPLLARSPAPVREIRRLYRDAIASAERLVYIENQYFTSRAVYDALLERMSDRSRPPINIVMVLPKRPHALREEITLGNAQMRMLGALRDRGEELGHSVGIYYPAIPEGEGEKPVYIHAKLLLVDDRFLTVGSANTTNRSMGLDSELNVAWEGFPPGDAALCLSIRRIRVSLLLEHSGVRGMGRWRVARELCDPDDLVSRLDRIAEEPESRLHRHTLDTLFEGREWMGEITPEEPLFDPEGALLEETVYELLSRNDFAGWLAEKSLDPEGAVVISGEKGAGPGASGRRPRRIPLWLVLLLLLVSSLLLVIVFRKAG